LVFGRDPEKCGIRMSENRISRRQFAVEANFNYGSLVIENYSWNGAKAT
jgi:hypothetical protein